MKIKIIPCLQDNYTYLIIDQKNNIACVVDPGESKPVIEYLENKKIQLKFILNTHHHFDHIDGNTELKNKYNAKIIGYEKSKNQIPGIDILLKDNEIWNFKNFETQIIHVPGHTLNHICFYFYNENIIFTGDTLFSLGCGKIFEGTHSQMFNSLNKIKKIPAETKIYCGHEYTLANSEFCIAHDINNIKLKNKIFEIKRKLSKKLPTIPTTLKEELECNIFLKSNTLDDFSKLRDLKDNF
tara:strand:- start:232 stop:951 length:720 start_codon:yes stop_codon:yes gene_type:complete